MSEFTARTSSDRRRLALGGDIDLATADQLDAVLAALSGDVDVDCTDVSFIGAMGFRSLSRGYRAALAAGATFVVSGMSAFQQRIAAVLSVPYVVE